MPALWKATHCGDAAIRRACTAALATALAVNALIGGDAPLRFPGNAIPLSGGLASADDWLMAAGMFLLAFDLLRQRPATDAQKSAPPAK